MFQRLPADVWWLACTQRDVWGSREIRAQPDESLAAARRRVRCDDRPVPTTGLCRGRRRGRATTATALGSGTNSTPAMYRYSGSSAGPLRATVYRMFPTAVGAISTSTVSMRPLRCGALRARPRPAAGVAAEANVSRGNRHKLRPARADQVARDHGV